MIRSDHADTPATSSLAQDGANAVASPAWPPVLTEPSAVRSSGVRALDGFVVAMAGVLLLGLLFRLPTLAGRSVWMDEAYSYWFANLSWTDLWTKTPFYETHPPFYYSMLKLWMTIAGSSETGMRSLSVLASLATIAVTGFAPRWLGFGRRYDRVGLLAAVLLAVNAGNIEYAQQARPYALQTLFCTLMVLASGALLCRMLGASRNARALPGEWPLCACLGLFAGITLWLHDTSPFIVLGNWLGLFGAILVSSPYRRHDLFVAIKALVIGLLVWAPCVPIILLESKTVESAFWATISPAMLTWPLTLASGGKYAFLAIAVLCALGWLTLYRTRRGVAFYVLAMLFIPMTAIFAVSYVIKPVFVVRTFEWMAPPVLLLAAFGMDGLLGRANRAAGSRAARRLLRLWRFAIPVVIALCFVQDGIYYRTPTEDLRGLVNYLAAGRQPGDLVLVYPNELEVGMDYYTRGVPDPFDVAAVPARYPAVGLHRPYLESNKGAPSAIESDRPQIERLLASHARVWFVGDWPGRDGKRDVVTDTLYRHYGAPVSSEDFWGAQVTLFRRHTATASRAP